MLTTEPPAVSAALIPPRLSSGHLTERLAATFEAENEWNAEAEDLVQLMTGLPHRIWQRITEPEIRA